jgi:uncharacterized membrane protein
MENGKFIITDLITFGLIAIVGALFGFSNAAGVAVVVGRAICCVSTGLAAVSLFVKRDPQSPL